MADTECETYANLIALLDAHGADYAIIDHEPAGITDVVSELRGHPAEQAAKCLMLMVKVSRHDRRHVLAVVPGDTRVDFASVAEHYAARYVAFCDPATAERLAKAPPGAVLPLPMDASVEVVVDPRVLAQPCLYFNAARLDRSLRLSTADYAAIVGPQVVPITTSTGPSRPSSEM